MRTKWVILKEREMRLALELDKLRHQLEGLENTPCNIRCGGCGEMLETEADFAKHFVVKPIDEMNNNLNLGWCPFKDTDKFN